ncbi:hypothetical protein M0L20_27120 [Spirosoma sp. RP8]|uniref:DUF6734 domain-containing protein n=1 Tax=Spirosoma liriopis TaxID=2937440 RepID=A0ABT0HTV1_9BACT|nr:DUF6734 family protein [Spirosoma liriopis]MCK8495567.1 hypothetical protein [Spirosoma liriopis]
MELIQTTWLSNDGQHIRNGGWIDERYHLMSCALSCLQLKAHYPELSLKLHTDHKGQQILIDTLQLPYDHIDNSLENIQLPFPEFMWVLKKIISYTLSTTDFLHIDSDIFIFDKLPSRVFESKLIVQNEEMFLENNTAYDETLSTIRDQFIYKPTYLDIASYKPGYKIRSINAGLIGGIHRFFINYAHEVFNFLSQNETTLKYLNKSCNTFIEQYILKKFAEATNTPISVLDQVSITGDYDGYADFHKVNIKKKYLHIMGDYKKRYWINQQVDQFLEMYHPQTHERVVKYLTSQNYFIYNNLNFIKHDAQSINFKETQTSVVPSYFPYMNFFYRSLYFVNKHIPITNLNLENFSILRLYLKNKIRNSKEKPLKSRLTDLFRYENQIFRHIHNLSVLTNNDVKQPVSKKDFESITKSSCQISWNKSIPIIQSKWDWSDTAVNNMLEKPSMLSLEDNLIQPETTIYVALYLDTVSKKVFEYKLDVISSHLVELLKFPISIQSIIDYFIDQYKLVNEPEKLILKDVVLTKISFFYLSNFLRINT